MRFARQRWPADELYSSGKFRYRGTARRVSARIDHLYCSLFIPYIWSAPRQWPIVTRFTIKCLSLLLCGRLRRSCKNFRKRSSVLLGKKNEKNSLILFKFVLGCLIVQMFTFGKCYNNSCDKIRGRFVFDSITEYWKIPDRVVLQYSHWFSCLNYRSHICLVYRISYINEFYNFY